MEPLVALHCTDGLDLRLLGSSLHAIIAYCCWTHCDRPGYGPGRGRGQPGGRGLLLRQPRRRRRRRRRRHHVALLP